jgi:hypothetical protein
LLEKLAVSRAQKEQLRSVLPVKYRESVFDIHQRSVSRSLLGQSLDFVIVAVGVLILLRTRATWKS